MTFDVSGRIEAEFPEGSPLYGATVIFRRDLPIAEALEMERAANAMEAVEEGPSKSAALIEFYRVFGETALKEWDLADGDEPIPATGQGMLVIGFNMASEIVRCWNNLVVGVDPNSNAKSANGASAEAAFAGTAP